MRFELPFLGLADLYRAYRKAKSDAFYEAMHFDAFAYAAYEQHLDRNLKQLLRRLQEGKWVNDLKFIGSFSYAPKGLDPLDSSNLSGMHFSQLDRLADWESCFRDNGNVRADAAFRLVIRASVNYQIISALWILKVGHLFEQALDKDRSYGNRLRRHYSEGRQPGEINRDCVGLFTPYFGAYRQWRKKGLQAMRAELEAGSRIVAVTMDVRRFYHNVSPDFLQHSAFQEFIGVALTDDQSRLTDDFLASMQTWYSATPDYQVRAQGALPVGLSASKVISNVLLAEFDQMISNGLTPSYYGRYVDDLFLVLRTEADVNSGEHFMQWLAMQFPTRLRFEKTANEYALRFSAPYCEASDVVFSGAKQKIFALEGRYGLDLVDHIEQQIRSQSSEHKLLPALPLTAGEMLSKALLATPDASLEADALRKADVVSVRRWGFSLLLGDVEAYARDLRSKDWTVPRKEFYGLVLRHVLTPKGFFDYFAYLNRVFGLMVACGDSKEAAAFIERFLRVSEVIGRTTTAGTTEKREFELCLELYAHSFFQAAVQSSTVRGFACSNAYLLLLRQIRKISKGVVAPATRERAKRLSADLLKADFGRRPYKEYWYVENRPVSDAPPVPRDASVRRVLRLGAIRKFRKDHVGKALREPYWPALAFPTRPLTLPEISQIAPSVFDYPHEFLTALLALRGARVAAGAMPQRFVLEDRPHLSHVAVPAIQRDKISIAVANFKTTNIQWDLALRGKQDRSLSRYFRINRIINGVLSSKHRTDYIAFPESSVPRRWAFSIADKLARVGISFIAGLENTRESGPYHNDALVSLATMWPGYLTHLRYIQPKISAAHHEAKELRKVKRRLYSVSNLEVCRPVFVHGGHCFGVLLCSDLTNISNRRHFQGHVDSLFVLEWNRDLSSFGSLVESTALDLHAYVVQVNNRAYGDSRVRAPRLLEYERDVVRLKGGDADYFVLATVRVADLRRFQSSRRPSKKLGFKPLPIGFTMSPIRRLVSKRSKPT